MPTTYRITRPVAKQFHDLEIPDDTVAVIYGRACSLDDQKRQTVEVWDWTMPDSPKLLIVYPGSADALRYRDLTAIRGTAATRGWFAHTSAAPVPVLDVVTPELAMQLSRQVHAQKRLNREAPYDGQQSAERDVIARRFLESGRYAEIQDALKAAAAA